MVWAVRGERSELGPRGGASWAAVLDVGRVLGGNERRVGLREVLGPIGFSNFFSFPYLFLFPHHSIY